MKINLKELAVFSMLAALMLVSKLMLEAIPNFHLLGVFTVAMTVVYRRKALYPIYLYVFMQGIIAGFNLWWLPYLYIWTVLWGMTMLLPKKMPTAVATVVYIAVCGLHGFLFGTLYAPAQAVMFGLNFKGMIAWIIAGLPYDIVHGVHNLMLGILIMPIIKILSATDRISRN